MTLTVSIITPFLNSEHFIPEFVSSIRSQRFQDWECLLVDDGSTDSSVELLRSIVSNDLRFRVLLNPSAGQCPGPASARNYAIRHARGEYIAFCDIDDLWHPQKLSLQMLFHATRGLDISTTGYGRFSSSLLSPLTSTILPPRIIAVSQLLTGNKIPMSTAVVHKRIFQERSFPHCRHEDYAFWLSTFLHEKNTSCANLPYLLAFYRVHSRNTTSFRLLMPFWVFIAYRNAGISRFRAMYYLFIWFLLKMKSLLLRDYRISTSFQGISVAELIESEPFKLSPG